MEKLSNRDYNFGSDWTILENLQRDSLGMGHKSVSTLYALAVILYYVLSALVLCV